METFQDRYGRRISDLRISVTDRCNLRCLYCMPEGIRKIPMAQILTYEQILEIAKTAVGLGITRFKVTGGEPFVRKDAGRFITALKRLPGVTRVSVTTNGILLAPEIERLKAAGIDGITISLDTADRETYRKITGTDALLTVLENLDACLDAGIPVKINAVAARGLNEKDALALAALAKERPVDVRFIEMMPVGAGRAFQGISGREILEELEKQAGEAVPDETVHGAGPAGYYRLPGFAGSVGFISPVSEPFCASCGRLRLTADGYLRPCLGYDERLSLWEALSAPEPEDRKAGIRAVFLQAAAAKPKGHRFSCGSDCAQPSAPVTPMAQIGG